jgi:hypothetical protein
MEVFMSKKTTTYAFLITTMFFIFVLSSSVYSQGHPLSGKKYGSLVFMKNSTTDKQANYNGDTVNYMETTRGKLPEIWVRAFLKNNIQHYVDYMKKKHANIQNMNFHFSYTVESRYYLNGEFQGGNTTSSKSYWELINVEKFTDLSVNTFQFKFSDLEKFVNFFDFKSKVMTLPTQMNVFRISCTLKFLCNYIDILEKTKVEMYADANNNGNQILAIKSEELDILNYKFFNLIIK